MLKSHILHMTHLGGVRHLHKHHIHRHGHGAYGSHQKKGSGIYGPYPKKGYGDFEDVASGHMNFMRNKALIGHGVIPAVWNGGNYRNGVYTAPEVDPKLARRKAEIARENDAKRLEQNKRFVLLGSGSKHGHKHIKPLKFKM